MCLNGKIIPLVSMPVHLPWQLVRGCVSISAEQTLLIRLNVFEITETTGFPYTMKPRLAEPFPAEKGLAVAMTQRGTCPARLPFVRYAVGVEYQLGARMHGLTES